MLQSGFAESDGYSSRVFQRSSCSALAIRHEKIVWVEMSPPARTHLPGSIIRRLMVPPEASSYPMTVLEWPLCCSL